MKKLIKHLEETLHKKIPVSRKMGITVLYYDANSILLSSPLKKNRNHKSTAFGGSIYSLMVLTGWSLIWMKMKEYNLNGSIVVKNSVIDFIKPIEKDMISDARFSDDTQFEGFLKRYKKRKMARVYVDIKIQINGTLHAKMQGEYVVTK